MKLNEILEPTRVSILQEEKHVIKNIIESIDKSGICMVDQMKYCIDVNLLKLTYKRIFLFLALNWPMIISYKKTQTKIDPILYT